MIISFSSFSSSFSFVPPCCPMYLYSESSETDVKTKNSKGNFVLFLLPDERYVLM